MTDDQRCATCRYWDRYLLHLGIDHHDDEPSVCQRIVDDPNGGRLAYVHATIEDGDEIVAWSGTDAEGATIAGALWTYADFGCVLWEARE